MIRPCFLVIDREHSGTISTRKLVIETAKFNVITAYSGYEGIETLEAFPAVCGVVLDAGIKDIPCSELIARLKQMHPRLPVVVVGGPHQGGCEGADHFVDSFNPAALLEKLQSLEPESTAKIARDEENLAD